MKGFYGILDVGVLGPSFVSAAATAFVRAGVTTLQLRTKALDARALVDLCRRVLPTVREAGARLIVNDRVDVALVVGADGVHLGRDDLPAADARRLLGPRAIVGVSTHSVAEAHAVAASGVASYLGFGPIFATSTKRDHEPVVGLEGLAGACAGHDVPIVAIGGISLDTCAAVRAAGASAVAMIGAVLHGDLVKNARRAVEACR